MLNANITHPMRKISLELTLTKEYVAQQYIRIPSKYRDFVPLAPRQRVTVYFQRAGESERHLTQAIIGPKGQRVFFRKASRDSGLPNPFEALELKVGDKLTVIIEAGTLVLIHRERSMRTNQ